MRQHSILGISRPFFFALLCVGFAPTTGLSEDTGGDTSSLSSGYFLTESRESGSPKVLIYEVRDKQVKLLGSGEAGKAQGWVSADRFWILDADEARSKITYGRVKNQRVQWNFSRFLGGKILRRDGSLLLIEPNSAMASFALHPTPFHNGNTALSWMRIKVFDLVRQEFLDVLGEHLLLPQPLDIVNERRRYLEQNGCTAGPCDAADVWDEAMVRTLGDDVLPIEVRVGDDGRRHVDICYRADALETVGPCLHKGSFSVIAFGQKRPKAMDTKEKNAHWEEISEGVHSCSSKAGSGEFKWPQPPPDPTNFCYRSTADGAQVEVGGPDFPAVWSEGIEGVTVGEEWIHLEDDLWLLSRNRSLCGTEDEWAEMEGDCSCTSLYLFKGCNTKIHGVFLEYGEGHEGVWFHSKGTDPAVKTVVVRRGIEVLGDVPSWSGLSFSHDQNVQNFQ